MIKYFSLEYFMLCYNRYKKKLRHINNKLLFDNNKSIQNMAKITQPSFQDYTKFGENIQVNQVNFISLPLLNYYYNYKVPSYRLSIFEGKMIDKTSLIVRISDLIIPFQVECRELTVVMTLINNNQPFLAYLYLNNNEEIINKRVEIYDLNRGNNNIDVTFHKILYRIALSISIVHIYDYKAISCTIIFLRLLRLNTTRHKIDINIARRIYFNNIKHGCTDENKVAIIQELLLLYLSIPEYNLNIIQYNYNDMESIHQSLIKIIKMLYQDDEKENDIDETSNDLLIHEYLKQDNINGKSYEYLQKDNNDGKPHKYLWTNNIDEISHENSQGNIKALRYKQDELIMAFSL